MELTPARTRCISTALAWWEPTDFINVIDATMASYLVAEGSSSAIVCNQTGESSQDARNNQKVVALVSFLFFSLSPELSCSAAPLHDVQVNLFVIHFKPSVCVGRRPLSSAQQPQQCVYMMIYRYFPVLCVMCVLFVSLCSSSFKKQTILCCRCSFTREQQRPLARPLTAVKMLWNTCTNVLSLHIE